MNELKAIIERMESVFSGEPWYGKSITRLLDEVDETAVYTKINGHAHTMIELLFHMLNWQEFALHRLQEDNNIDPQRYQLLDWRETDPSMHTWNTGIAAFTGAHNKIVELLKRSPDELLSRQVQYRPYDMRFLLNGLIEHNIYHIGQITLINKVLRSSG